MYIVLDYYIIRNGITKRRTWRKLHIGIDVNTQEIICVDLTTNSQDDASIATKILKGKTEKLKSFRDCLKTIQHNSYGG